MAESTGTDTDHSSVVSSSGEPDYSAVELPSKDRTEFTYVERRAELLQLIAEAGHPEALNQTELAEQFGVSQQQISKDLNRLGAYIREQFANRDRRALRVDRVVQRSVRGLLDEGEYQKAARTMMEYEEWLAEFHDIERMEAEIERLEHIAKQQQEARF